MRSQWFVGTVLFVIGLVGCGEPTATVSGRVTFRGKPLAGATVTFFPSNNKTFHADTATDGTFSVPVTGQGTIRVTVQVPPPRPTPRPEPPNSPKAGIANDDDKAKMSKLPPPSELPKGTIIPAKYNAPDTSGLSFELTGKAVRFDIELK